MIGKLGWAEARYRAIAVDHNFSGNSREALKTVATSIIALRIRYTTRKRPTMISRNFGLIPLGNDSSRVRKLEQSFDGNEDSRHGQIGVTLRIFGDVFVDGIKVAQRLWRPYNVHYSPKRRFASSCGTPSDRSSSANPASTLARNTSRSIASSIVASGGIVWSASMMRSRVNGSSIAIL